MIGNSTEYFQRCFIYDSLFIFSDLDGQGRKVVCEIKSVNSGLEEISFVPLAEDNILFEKGETIMAINEMSNISFEAEVLTNHGKKWMTLKMPDELKVVNLRNSPRVELEEKKLLSTQKILSFGEEGVKKLSEYEGELVDISSGGASFEVKARRIDALYKGEKVELHLSSHYSSLNRVRGQIVYKAIARREDPDLRSYRIGVKWEKNLDMSALS